MSQSLRKLIERIIEIMKKDGISNINIRRNYKWNRESQMMDDTGKYSVHMDYDDEYEE